MQIKLRAVGNILQSIAYEMGLSDFDNKSTHNLVLAPLSIDSWFARLRLHFSCSRLQNPQLKNVLMVVIGLFGG